MFYSNCKFLIVGLASSGLAISKQLLNRGAKCYIFDEGDAPYIARNKEQLSLLGAIDVISNVESYVESCDVVVLSPGIAVDHSIAVLAKRLKKRIVGELELGSLMIKAPIVAVTGTNGKTTTSSIIYDILLTANIKSSLVGNVGTPISAKVEELDSNAVAVVEVSSFQLETIHLFCPHIAVVLNITPDHLERHYNMQNYIYLKRRILVNMRESEYAVLNYDDEVVRSFANGLRCKVVWFSSKGEVDGAYFQDQKIYFKGEYIMSTTELKLSGTHNIENVLAGVCVANILDIPNSVVQNTMINFRGVKHRIEFVGEYDGISYFNDSKATNVDATIKAIDSLTQSSVLILGGKDKDLSYHTLFERIASSKVKHCVLLGETKYKMLESARKTGVSNVTLTNSFENAILIAKCLCESGDAVLLSPATSSFDMFSGFEERGEEFKRIVEVINGEDEKGLQDEE